MFSSVLDAYVDDDDEGGSCVKRSAGAASSAASASRPGSAAAATAEKASDSAAGHAAAAAGHSALSRFASPPRKKRIDVLRLQMCCPTIVGAAVDSATADGSSREQRVSAHSLFAFPLPRAPEGVAGPGNASRGAAAPPRLTSASSSRSSSSCSADSSAPHSSSTDSSGGGRVKLEREDGECLRVSAARPAQLLCRTSAPAEAGTVAGRRGSVDGEPARTVQAEENDAAAEAAHSATAEGAHEAGEGRVFLGCAAAVGPDGIPLVKYERGVFDVAEEAPAKEFRVKREPVQTQRLPAAAEEAAACENGGSQRRGKMLLSMLPKPQQQQQVPQLFPPVAHSLQQRARRSSGGSSTGQPAALADSSTNSRRRGDTGSSSPGGGRSNSTERNSCARRGGASDGAGCESSRAAGQDEEGGTDGEADGEERGPLFSLFSAYDDETEDTAAGAVAAKEEERERKGAASAGQGGPPADLIGESNATATAGTERTAGRLPLLGVSFDTKDEPVPSDTKGSSSTGDRLGVGYQQLVEGSGRSGEASTADALVCGDGELVTAPYVDVWGDTDAAAAAGGNPTAGAGSTWGAASAEADLPPNAQFQQRQVDGMSLNEYREMQNARVKVVSGESLRDPDWQLNYQLHATPAQAKRTKLNITTNVWSVKEKGIVQTVEPRAMQKRKHQINWLAAEAAEKELEMWEMMAKTRQNKYNTSMKYGW